MCVPGVMGRKPALTRWRCQQLERSLQSNSPRQRGFLRSRLGKTHPGGDSAPGTIMAVPSGQVSVRFLRRGRRHGPPIVAGPSAAARDEAAIAVPDRVLPAAALRRWTRVAGSAGRSSCRVGPHERIVARAFQELGIDQRREERLRGRRVQAPEALHLWSRQAQAWNFQVLGADHPQPVRDVGVSGQRLPCPRILSPARTRDNRAIGARSRGGFPDRPERLSRTPRQSVGALASTRSKGC